MVTKASFLKKFIKKKIFNIVGEKEFYATLEKITVLKQKILRSIRTVTGNGRFFKTPYPTIKFGNNDHQYFFGYYDVSPFNHDNSILLSLGIPIKKASVFTDTFINIGYFKTSDPETFHCVDNTSTWCWQQGSRLQWYPLNEKGMNNTIIYNKIIDNVYGCCTQDIHTKKIINKYHSPVYSLSPDGRIGLSLNFARLGRLRPGYGYMNFPDATESQKAPEKDGIWQIDMDDGKSRLLFSVADITRFEPLETMQGAEHYFNHISINPNGTRFLFFHVWLQKNKRYTRLITCNMDGGEPFALINEGHVSHYAWKSADELLCFSTHYNTGMKYHLYKDKSNQRTVIGNGLLDKDGHPSFSPDLKYLLVDTYPDHYSDRNLLLYDCHNETLNKIGSFFSPFHMKGELRCDLHPRWNSSGDLIAFDSAHEGYRSIYSLEYRNT